MKPTSRTSRSPALSIGSAGNVGLVAVALMLAACFEPAFRDDQYRCGNAGCPPGLACAEDGWCRALDLDVPDATTAGVPVSDAGRPVAPVPPADAAPPAPDATSGASQRWEPAPADAPPPGRAVP